MALREDGARQYDGVTTGEEGGDGETEGGGGVFNRAAQAWTSYSITSRASYHGRLSFVNLPSATIQASYSAPCLLLQH